MVEEAFALSPISARPTVPGEADYEAIREAFMETSRGRWFLNEYAKRNRTADTNIVLEAVSRLEQNLSNRKDGVNLADTLGAIRAALRAARVMAVEALPRQESDITYAAARDGARMIGEITKSLREYGADKRICDLLDAQVMAIQAGQKVDNSEARKNVLAAFDTLSARLEQIITQGAPSGAAAEAPAAASERSDASVTPLFRSGDTGLASQMVAEKMRIQEAAAAAVASAAAQVTAAPQPVARPPVAGRPAAEPAPAAQKAVPTPAPQPVADSGIAMDLAVLDLVALEMGAEQDDDGAVIETATATAEPAAPAPAPAIAAAPAARTAATQTYLHSNHVAAAQPVTQADAPAARPSFTPPPQAAAPAPAARQEAPAAAAPARASQASAPEQTAVRHPADRQLAERVIADRQRQEGSTTLGASLINNGVVPPIAAVEDALAVIRRMSQAERLAFFS